MEQYCKMLSGLELCSLTSGTRWNIVHKTLSFCYVSLGDFFSSVNITVFQLVEVEMNKAVKRECNLKARWGTGRSGGPAPLCDCKVLYSHCLKEKVEELCDKIIEHAATRKIDLHSKDDSLAVAIISHRNLLTGTIQ